MIIPNSNPSIVITVIIFAFWSNSSWLNIHLAEDSLIRSPEPPIMNPGTVTLKIHLIAII